VARYPGFERLILKRLFFTFPEAHILMNAPDISDGALNPVPDESIRDQAERIIRIINEEAGNASNP
jgi:hypothetical protein